MAIELTMPALSPTMEKGTLAKWLVREGDLIKSGDLLAEIETDKATMEFEAVEAGRIERLFVADGTDDIAVGTVIALLGNEQTTPLDGAVIAVAGPAEAASPDPDPVATPAAAPRIVEGSASRRRPSPAERVKVSPMAQRIANVRGIDLSEISGSGPDGRIVRADLIKVDRPHRQERAPETVAAEVAPSIAAAPPPDIPLETSKLSAMRRTIARRLAESKQTVPHFYLTVRCNLDPLLSLRTELNLSVAERAVKISVNDLLLKATALALAQVPEANVQFGGEVLHRFQRVDIAMAVAVDGGLITPVIQDVASLSLLGIAQRSRTLAMRAREGSLRPEDYQGGTASLSNLGMFGVDEMIPVINPPQALILGTAAGIVQPWNVGGELALATVMAATASFDHRAIDGATGARFMAAFRELVEKPLLICA